MTQIHTDRHRLFSILTVCSGKKLIVQFEKLSQKEKFCTCVVRRTQSGIKYNFPLICSDSIKTRMNTNSNNIPTRPVSRFLTLLHPHPSLSPQRERGKRCFSWLEHIASSALLLFVHTIAVSSASVCSATSPCLRGETLIKKCISGRKCSGECRGR